MNNTYYLPFESDSQAATQRLEIAPAVHAVKGTIHLVPSIGPGHKPYLIASLPADVEPAGIFGDYAYQSEPVE